MRCRRCCCCCRDDDDGPFRDYEGEARRRREAEEKRHDMAVELLATEEVIEIRMPERAEYGLLRPGNEGILDLFPHIPTHATLLTEAGSYIDLRLQQVDAELLRAGGVAYMQAEAESITIWTGKRRKITAHVDHIMVSAGMEENRGEIGFLGRA